MSGSLVVVGTGIGPARLTKEARVAITSADTVLFAAGDVLTAGEIARLNSEASSLAPFFENGTRQDAYERIVEAILEPARAGLRVCAAFYGHAGMFVLPAGEAIRRARTEGIDARMLPGVSSLDCLLADLGVDPAAAGLQLYEASRFVHRTPVVEVRAGLVLLQVGVVPSRTDLVATLRSWYPASHELVIYEASPYPGVAPRAERLALARLDRADLTTRSTVYVPPLGPR